MSLSVSLFTSKPARVAASAALGAGRMEYGQRTGLERIVWGGEPMHGPPSGPYTRRTLTVQRCWPRVAPHRTHSVIRASMHREDETRAVVGNGRTRRRPPSIGTQEPPPEFEWCLDETPVPPTPCSPSCFPLGVFRLQQASPGIEAGMTRGRSREYAGTDNAMTNPPPSVARGLPDLPDLVPELQSAQSSCRDETR